MNSGYQSLCGPAADNIPHLLFPVFPESLLSDQCSLTARRGYIPVPWASARQSPGGRPFRHSSG